ncbi:MAG TPA: hypothetical protein VF989_12675 [Polyangiaceae bacterium]|jgi:hypothetical protein
MTRDLDILYSLDENNVERLVAAFEELDAVATGARDACALASTTCTTVVTTSPTRAPAASTRSAPSAARDRKRARALPTLSSRRA